MSDLAWSRSPPTKIGAYLVRVVKEERVPGLSSGRAWPARVIPFMDEGVFREHVQYLPWSREQGERLLREHEGELWVLWAGSSRDYYGRISLWERQPVVSLMRVNEMTTWEWLGPLEDLVRPLLEE